MRKRLKTFFNALLLMGIAMLSVTGCDFFRFLAGRPTSAEIDAKRAVIEKEEAAHQARMDSLAKARKAASDSIALIDAIKQERGTILSVGNMPGLSSASLGHRYCIIIGTFANSDNAQKLVAKATSAGYKAIAIPYRNGFTAVGLCPSNSLSAVYESLTKVRGEDFCPQDVWVLVNE